MERETGSSHEEREGHRLQLDKGGGQKTPLSRKDGHPRDVKEEMVIVSQRRTLGE